MGYLSRPRLSKYISFLTEKRKGFSLSQSRRPKGYAQIDVQGERGRLAIRVKNLLPEPTYDVWLVSGQQIRSKTVKMGRVQVDNRGEGLGHWEFSSKNVKGSGRGVEVFEHVLVTARQDDASRDKEIVLMGEMELQVAESYDGLNVEKVDPFGPAMPNHSWWKFYPNYLLSDKVTGQPETEPVTDHQAAEQEEGIRSGPVFRGHQLIGLNYDEKGAVNCLVHGIPGRFCIEDQPDGGTSGYVYWQPLPGQQYREGHYGYWLVHIDAESGEVVYPRRQTPPPGSKDVGDGEIPD